MCALEQEPIYEEKMDDISLHLEELIIDAILSALNKLIERNRDFNLQKCKTGNDPF
jgi:hypothetical protein